MNLSIAVIGASKAGKTLFCINFAEYMGAGNLSYAEYTPGGQGRGLLSPAGARRLMVGRSGRGNGVLRIFTVHLPPRPYRRLALIDTVALQAKNPLPRSGRSQLLLTLQAMERADLILMLFDLSCTDPALQEFNDRAGGYMADYCRQRGKLFLPGGSKADLLSGSPGGKTLFAAGGELLHISSLRRAGFPLLKKMILGAPLAAVDYGAR
ncbi:MAG: hypothetical protein ACOX30_06210 [Dethiobacteria bacterium]|jgi:hypothetical protein